MMTLKGIKKVNIQLTGLGRFQPKVVTALTANAPAMEKQARQDVLEVVYSAPVSRFPLLVGMTLYLIMQIYWMISMKSRIP